MDSNLFFVIESTDAATDQVQVKLLEKKLIAAGYDVASFVFPRFNQPSGFFADQYAKNSYGSDSSVGPYTSSLFYTLDHYQAAIDIRSALADGKVVLASKFVGSIMAKQGSLFNNDEERRGYYIWLDNLEFIMLKVPRPSKSFVLREATANNTTTAYDDLCNLFPQDFQRIDTARSGKPLSAEALSDIVWSSIQTMLPVREAESEPENTTSTNASGYSRKFELDGVSLLLAHQIAASGLVDFQCSFDKAQDPSTVIAYGFYAPTDLNPKVASNYQEVMQTVIESYKLACKKLAQKDTDPQLSKLLKDILPTAVKTNITIFGSPTDMKSLISSLLANPLPEAKSLAQNLQAKVQKQLPTFKVSAPVIALTEQTPELSGNYGQQEEALRLTDFAPRNEFDLLSGMLYGSSHLSLDELRAEISDWNYAQKATAFTNSLTSTKLPDTSYVFDVLDTFDNIRKLSGHGTLTTQTLTPRYGYDIADAVDQAGLSELFEACFDASLKLHSVLTSTNAAEAPYATLLGHRTRAQLRLMATDLQALPNTNSLKASFLEKITEVHPLTGERLGK